jgi:hypothetical protein
MVAVRVGRARVGTRQGRRPCSERRLRRAGLWPSPCEIPSGWGSAVRMPCKHARVCPGSGLGADVLVGRGCSYFLPSAFTRGAWCRRTTAMQRTGIAWLIATAATQPSCGQTTARRSGASPSVEEARDVTPKGRCCEQRCCERRCCERRCCERRCGASGRHFQAAAAGHGGALLELWLARPIAPSEPDVGKQERRPTRVGKNVACT